MKTNIRATRDNLTCAAFVVAIMALAFFYSRGRIMWSDELFGWMLVTDPSFRHMLHAWNAGADGGGICFYVLARLWLDVFGRTAIAFRAFSAAGVATAAVLTFRAGRRFFRWEIVLFAVSLIWFSSDVVLWQIMQGRFYGLLLAEVAAASYLFLLTLDQITRGRLVLTFLGHTLLVGTHPFGVLYSGVVILTMICWDALERRLRPTLYAAAFGGWWILLATWKEIPNAAAIGKPHSWTVTPRLGDLGNAYSCWSLLTSVVLACAVLLLLASLALGRIRREEIREAVQAHRPILLLSAGLLSIPLFVFLISQGARSLFVDRYLLPVVIGMCFLLCQILTSLVPAESPVSPSRSLASRLFAYTCIVCVPVLLWTAVVEFPSGWVYPGPDTLLGLIPLLPKDLPIVVEPADLFNQLLAYHRDPEHRFVYLLDWPNAVAPDSPRDEVSGYNEMKNWKKVGYFSGSIEDAGSFLARTPAFAVIDRPGYLWLQREVRSNSAFQVQAIGPQLPTAPGGVRLWMVRRCPDLR